MNKEGISSVFPLRTLFSFLDMRRILLLLLFSGVAAAQTTIRVPADRSTVQAAILAASTGDTILVSAGTYRENIDFSGKAVTVKGAGDPQLTILDGGATAPVVTFRTSEGSGSVLTGFTIQNGKGNEGGGITIQGASPTITGNRIINNQACSGGGIGVGFGSPLIQGNVISGNTSASCGGLGGGGIEFRGASTGRVLGNVISGNSNSDGGGIVLWAGGAVTLRGNVITGNTATGAGGGIATVNSAPAVIVQNLIADNKAFSAGGLSFSNPPASLISNTIANNEATGTSGTPISGMVTSFNTQLRIINNIFSAKAGETAIGCGTFSASPVSGTFRSNDVFSAGPSAYTAGCVDQTGANGNISSDPGFLNPSAGNYRLQSSSPAIGAGDASVSELPATDLDGNPRTTGGKLDLGAYEYPGPTTVKFSGTSLSFSNQALGTSSSVQAVTITNTGNAPLQFATIVASGDFSQVNTCPSGLGLAPGGICIISVTFTPTARGPRTGSVTFTSNATGSPHTVALSGIGIAPVVVLSPGVLTFANQLVGTSSSPQQVAVTNTGDSSLVFGSIVASAEFAQSNTCDTPVPPGGNCAISVTFQPTGSGSRTGTITLNDNAPGSPQIVALTGNGQASVPAVTAVTPNSATAGSAAFTLTVTGSNFVTNSVARWNGVDHPTTFVSSLQLKAAIAASDVAAGGTIAVTVFNLPPGGGESNAVTFTVSNAIPAITTLSPSSALVGGPDFQLTVNGSRFVPGSVVRWNGLDRTTSFVNSAQLRATISAADISLAGTSQVTVFNAAPGGGLSNSATFTALTPSPLPVLVAISPVSMTAGTGSFTLTASGSGFNTFSVVQWNRASRPTTFISDSELQAIISASDIAAGGTAQVAVVNPPPGGGTSTLLPFTILGSPLPFLTSVSPSSVLGGGSGFTLTVNGSGFLAGSVVRWNDQDRLTTFVSDRQLTASILGSDVAVVGTARVTIYNPPPGGGVSNSGSVGISANPAPRLDGLTPFSAGVGSPDLTLTLRGSNFTTSSVARWNGMARTTVFVDSTQLRLTIPAADLATPGLVEVSVFNPPLGGGLSNAAYFAVTVVLPAKDLVYDKTRGKLYASVPSSAGSRLGNQIVPIDPVTGDLGQGIFVGSEPGKMAISGNDQYLYVSLDGVAAVRRVDLDAQTADLQFALGSDSFFGPYYVDDMDVMPGSPNTIAVSRKNLGISPRHAGVAIYDDGVKRSKETQRHTGSDVIAFSSSASTLYGLNNETTEFGFRTLSVTPDGVTETKVAAAGALGGFGTDIKFENGRIYSTSGRILDPVTGNLTGTFTFPGGGGLGPVAPDSSVGRTFFVVSNFGSGGSALAAFDQATYTLIGSAALQGLSSNTSASSSLVRWGEDGLAFLANSQIFLLRSTLVKPPVVSAGSTVNGASFALGPVSPGGIVSLFGAGLALSAVASNSTPLPVSLGGASVTLNGTPVPLLYVSPLQVNFQVPWEMAGRAKADLAIGFPGSSEKTVSLDLATYAPGIFTLPGGQGAVLIADSGALAAPATTAPGARPANRGDIVSIYCTGLGPVTNQPGSGAVGPGGSSLAATTVTPEVTIGGQQTAVSFAGLAPGFVGLYQVNVQIPANVASGNALPLTLRIGGVAANTVSIAVQ